MTNAMGTLPEKLENLKGKVSQLADLEREGRETERYRTRDRNYAEPYQTLLPLIESYQVLRTRELAPPLDKAILFRCRATVEAARNEFIKDRMRFANETPDGSPIKSSPQLVRDVAILLKDCLRNTWQDHLRSQISSIDPSVLGIFGRLFPRGGEVLRLMGELQRRYYDDFLPRTDEQYREAAVFADRLRTAWESFVGTEQVPPEVVEFLKKVSEGRARLNDLSMVVREWLTRNRMDSQFKVIT